jgi:hypothetical protein
MEYVLCEVRTEVLRRGVSFNVSFEIVKKLAAPLWSDTDIHGLDVILYAHFISPAFDSGAHSEFFLGGGGGGGVILWLYIIYLILKIVL